MEEDHGLAQRLALIRFYFHAEPKSSTQFSLLWNRLQFALRFEGKLKVEEIKRM